MFIYYPHGLRFWKEVLRVGWYIFSITIHAFPASTRIRLKVSSQKGACYYPYVSWLLVCVAQILHLPTRVPASKLFQPIPYLQLLKSDQAGKYLSTPSRPAGTFRPSLVSFYPQFPFLSLGHSVQC